MKKDRSVELSDSSDIDKLSQSMGVQSELSSEGEKADVSDSLLPIAHLETIVVHGNTFFVDGVTGDVYRLAKLVNQS